MFEKEKKEGRRGRKKKKRKTKTKLEAAKPVCASETTWELSNRDSRGASHLEIPGR